MGALWASELAGRGHEVPRVALIRVGAAGVELLLHEPCPVAPSPFRAGAGGLTWSLDPSIELEALIELGQDSRPSLDGGAPSLLEVRADDEGSYFVTAGDIVRLRLDDDEPGELHDELPSRALQDPGWASGPLFGAPLVVVGRGEQLLLEPFGLSLTASPESSPPAAHQSIEEVPIGAVPRSDPKPEELDAVDLEDRNPPATTDGSTQVLTVPPGPVEVRILRELPDLVGELHEEPTAGAVEFIAYLALHGYRAAPARLKETLGTPRSQASRSGKSVWTAAGAARRAIGPDLVPAASGNQLYLLSKEVSCDWTRFQALVGIARSAASDPERRREALVGALELVDGVPGLASRRFTWLDTEGVLSNIAFAVASAARELANLEAEGGSEELSRWAIAKARPLLPDLGELEHQEPKLASTRLRAPSRR